MSLYQFFSTNSGRPINKWPHYFPIYERYFQRFVDRRITFVEIGSGQGGSSQMWKYYFGPAAQIVTLDIRPECRVFEEEQIAVRIGDQGDAAFLADVVAEFGPPDIVLDDGSHQMGHVNASFSCLFPQMAREAVYMVEDMHTSYWPAWGGGLKAPGTFIERMKDLVDQIHAESPHNAIHDAGDMPTGVMSKLARAVHFYDSVVVIEKGSWIAKAPRSIPFIEGQTIW